MADAELQKKIDEAVEKATKALKDKNDELLTELKKERKDRLDAEKKSEEADAEKRKAEELAEEEKAKKAGDFDKLKKQLEEKHAKDLEKARAETTTVKGQLSELLIDKGLSDALVIAKVAPQLQEAAIALIKQKHKTEVAEVGGKAIAQIDGKPISEFIPAWSQSDNGKHFVAAPGNGGGGAGGSNGGGGAASGKKLNRADFDKLSPVDQMKHVKDGGSIEDAA